MATFDNSKVTIQNFVEVSGGGRPDEVGGVVGQATVEVSRLTENYVDYFGKVGGCAERNEEDQLE